MELHELLLALFLPTIVLISPVELYPLSKINLELTANYFEGDMMLTDKQLQAVEASSTATRSARNAVLDNSFRWPKGIVHYVVSKEFSSEEVEIIYNAMQHISTETCIRFKEMSTDLSSKLPNHTQHYLKIRPSNKGCSASVGYRGTGVQYLNLVPMSTRSVGCFTKGTVVHELLHSLGMYHQQSTYDRDHYVRILYENIQAGWEYNFKKLPYGFSGSYGVGYDYGSVMHYESFAFSRNGKATIEPLREYHGKIGQRVGLSQKDIMKLKFMYLCSS